MKKFYLPELNKSESDYLWQEMDSLLKHYNPVPQRKRRRARYAYTSSLWENNAYLYWRFNNPNMAMALNKVYYAITGRNHNALPCELINQTTQPHTINGKMPLVFTKKEVKHLVKILHQLLNEFSLRGYNGRKFTNPDMANAFNKLYYALTGRNHPNMCPDHYNAVCAKHYAALNG